MVTSSRINYETIIGLETHVQLLTKSKMFCSCSADYAGALPNTHVCPICLGMPGVLPAINWKAVEYAAMTALALNCSILDLSRFDRKNYPYPDLVKGYQISQYDAPIGSKGWLAIEVQGVKKRVGITRVHLEEDTAKLVHRHSTEGEFYSLVDVNRAGVPLLEIVGEPDLRTPEEARQYLIALRTILQYLGVSTGNMEEGSFRCDANISLRPKGNQNLSGKVEVKNMNSFRAVFRALEFEQERQRKVLEQGERPIQETRGWVDEKGITVSQRTKEYAHDYRYFPEPDLPPMRLSPAWVEEIRRRLPELPEATKERLVARYGLTAYDAAVLTTSKDMAEYFEACLQHYTDPATADGGTALHKKAKTVSNWLQGEFLRLLNSTGTDLKGSRITPQDIAELLRLVDEGTLSGPASKEVFEGMFQTGQKASLVVSQRGLAQISNEEEMERMVAQVITANPQAVGDYLKGKPQAMGFLVGQVMKATKGRANPELANKLLTKRMAKQQS